MIPRIKKVEPLENFLLHVVFDDGKNVIYDVKDDIKNIPSYSDLQTIHKLFDPVQLEQFIEIKTKWYNVSKKLEKIQC